LVSNLTIRRDDMHDDVNMLKVKFESFSLKIKACTYSYCRSYNEKERRELK